MKTVDAGQSDSVLHVNDGRMHFLLVTCSLFRMHESGGRKVFLRYQQFIHMKPKKNSERGK